jgi:hypothetical protein
MECPQCGKQYKPKYRTKEKAEEKGDKVAIEQHVSYPPLKWWACL